MGVYNSLRGDKLMDFAYKVRCMVFKEWAGGGCSVVELCQRYGFSRKWFYKYKGRFLEQGFEGLRDKIRSFPCMPHALSYYTKAGIMNYVYDNPTHGPRRINMNLAKSGMRVSEGAIYNFLAKEELNSKRKRLLWAHSQGKKILTNKQKAYLCAQKRHIESSYPGELVSIDTFWINIKSLRRVWQYTACDTYSSFGWAKLYRDRNSDNTTDFLENHVLKSLSPGKIKRLLTDQGTEFYSARHKTSLFCLDLLCKGHNIRHTVTKKGHPWTNGYAERLNRTIWDEFYLCRLNKSFRSLGRLQKELDIFMKEYNFRRIHTGYKLKSQGYEYPYQAFFDIKEGSDMAEKVGI